MNTFHKNALLNLLILLVQVNTTRVEESDLKLSLVHLIFRHGDRNPVGFIESQNSKPIPIWNGSWPEGFGQLTNAGKLQHYRIGQYLRERYKGFISERYSPSELYVEASDTDRTIMSALTNLAGLYPPVEGFPPWNRNLTWEPIPVHTIPSHLDNKLRLKAPCPRYDGLHAEKVKEVNDKSRGLYERLTNVSGKLIHDLDSFFYLYDFIYTENLHGREIPNWAEKILMDEEVMKLENFSFELETFTDEMKRLRGGPLIKEIVEHLIQKITGRLEDRKMFMYFAHDTTLAVLLNSINLYDKRIPPPLASFVLVELFRNDNNGSKNFVRIGFKNSTGEPNVLILPGCQEFCPLQTFVKLCEPVIPVNWKMECKADDDQHEHLNESPLNLNISSAAVSPK